AGPVDERPARKKAKQVDEAGAPRRASRLHAGEEGRTRSSRTTQERPKPKPLHKGRVRDGSEGNGCKGETRETRVGRTGDEEGRTGIQGGCEVIAEAVMGKEEPGTRRERTGIQGGCEGIAEAVMGKEEPGTRREEPEWNVENRDEEERTGVECGGGTAGDLMDGENRDEEERTGVECGGEGIAGRFDGKGRTRGGGSWGYELVGIRGDMMQPKRKWNGPSIRPIRDQTHKLPKGGIPKARIQFFSQLGRATTVNGRIALRVYMAYGPRPTILHSGHRPGPVILQYRYSLYMSEWSESSKPNFAILTS
ncbi:hypothetical protein B0H12DRAFT_1082450, partial [Mycena haematopus]